MTVARLYQPAPKAKEPVVQAKARPVKVSRSPRSARDPRFMRAVDLLQQTSARTSSPSATMARRADDASVMPAPLQEPNDLRFSSVLDAQRMAEGGARVSSPHDPAEQEAEAAARRVATMAEPGPAREIAAAPRAEVARLGGGPSHATPETMAEISNAGPLGRPLPTTVRRFMEPRFRADFSGVRIHTSPHAARLSRRLNAQAFTVGHQIFFGGDRFRPESHEGRELIAHELTHTIQQGAAVQEAVQRREDASVSSAVPPHVQRLGLGDVLDWLADKANNIPGFRMFTIVLGVNPINMRTVDRSAANILRAIVEFMPGGNIIVQALDKYGVFDKAGSWIEGQLASLGLSGSSIKASVTQFIDSLGVSDLFHPGAVWDRAKAIFTTPIDRIITFVGRLAAQVIQMIKDAVLRPLAELASRSDGWDLLCAVLGRNPITGEAVPRNAETLIGGFMKLIGQQEIWENIKKANAISRAWAWFQTALEELFGFVREFPTTFINALKSLEIEDIIVLPLAFVKVGRAFAGFIGRFLSWAGGTIWNLLEIIFAVVAPGVMVYLRKAAAAFRTILQNPAGFVRNLIAAGKQGLSQFVSNFLKHLKAAMIGWLTGALGGAGLYIPQALTLPEIGKFVLSILGITWPKIREKIVKVIGETAMKALETGLDIVIALIRGGPAAAWEIIKQKLTELKDMVVDSVISFVKDKIVSAAVTKLLSLLSPVGAFIQAIIGIYNTVMFFIERMKQIAQVAAAVIDSISAIANGVIGAAANKVERTMAGLLTLVISFLARIAGLGNVSDAVVGFIKKVQAKVDKAIDAGIAWIVEKAKSIFKSLLTRGDNRTDAQKQADLDKAMDEGQALLATKRPPAQIKARLAAIKSRYRMTSLELVTDSKTDREETDHLEGLINPGKKNPSVALPLGEDPLVGEVPIDRPDFTQRLKRLFRERYPDAHQPDGKLLDDIDRRHIISSDELAKHIQNKLRPLKVSQAATLLKQKGSPVTDPATKEKVIAAAQKRHRKFFNELSNLWPGPASPNRALGARRDPPGPGEQFVAPMPPADMEAHEKAIYDNFGLD